MIIWQKLHKWLAVIVGAQILLWVLTGLLLNLTPHEWLDSNTHFSSPAASKLKHADILTVEQLLTDLPADSVTHVALTSSAIKPIYRVTDSHDRSTFLWADTLAPVLLTLDQIAVIAASSYQGKVGFIPPVEDIVATKKSHSHSIIYRVDVMDDVKTRIYIDNQSAQIIGHENQYSDWRDFLLMLHFMDYVTEDGLSFNHWWLQLLALLSLCLGVSGAGLIYYQIKKGGFQLRSTSTMPIYLLDKNQQHLCELAGKSTRLIDTINQYASTHNDTDGVATSCGGGGECGLCMVQFISPAPEATEHEIKKISIRKRDQGYRLSCQHSSHKLLADDSGVIKIAFVNNAQHMQWQSIDK